MVGGCCRGEDEAPPCDPIQGEIHLASIDEPKLMWEWLCRGGVMGLLRFFATDMGNVIVDLPI